MNPSSTVVDPQPPPVPPQPHRPSTSCDRHPEENFSGFCPSCLCERLAVLHPNTTSSASSSSSSRKPPTSSTAAAALKAIFKPSSSSSATGGGGGPSNSNNKLARPSTSFFPELRRTKSFSASKNEGFFGVFEPQRKSCDVRGRNTLWCLFNQDDGRNPNKKDQPTNTTTEAVETRNVAGPSSSFRGRVFEFKEEEEEDDYDYEDEEQSQRKDVGQFVVSEQQQQGNAVEIGGVPEIVEEEDDDDDDIQQVVHQQSAAAPVVQFPEEMRPMKDHIDMDAQTKKRDLKEIAGSFWSAASVFSKKLQKWRQKQKLKKRRSGGGSATLPVEKPIGRQFRETQSEIADYGFGRRSCDTDPRFSLDAGRMSFDDPRYSFDEPRASWDGHLLGRPAFTRMPTMLSVVEDSPVFVVSRTDAQIPVEEVIHSINEEDPVPGGSLQTQSYYSDSSSRRRKSLDAGRKSLDGGRKSLDRSSSIRRTAAAAVAEIDEMKSVSNSKVSPTPTDYFHGPKLVMPDRDHLRDSNSNSLRDDCSETFEMAFRVGDPVLVRGGGDSASVIGNGRKEYKQKSKRWSKGWNIWNFINRRSGNKEDDEDRYRRPNGVDRSFSESWPELRGSSGEHNGEAKGFNPKIARSNSSASWRNSRSFGSGVFGSMRRNGAVEPTVNVNVNGNGSANGTGTGNGRKKKEEFLLERNRSARFSPSHIDNGLLRFYLTPSWRNGGGAGKSRSNPAHSIARSVLRLY